MRFVKQAIISYTSPNISPEFANWSPVTTYAVGDKVLWKNYIWINSKTANLNNEPSLESAVWAKYDASNYYSLIDTQSQTSTEVIGDDLIVTFPSGYIDTIAIGYYTAQTIKIENLDSLGNVVIPAQIIKIIKDIFVN